MLEFMNDYYGGGVSLHCSIVCVIAIAIVMGILTTLCSIYFSDSKIELEKSLHPTQKYAYRKMLVERATLLAKSIIISIIIMLCVFPIIPKKLIGCNVIAFTGTCCILLYMLTRKYHHSLSFLEGRHQLGLWWDMHNSIHYSFYAGITITLVGFGIIWYYYGMDKCPV